MTEMKIIAGMKRQVTAKVTDENTAIAMKSGSLPVFATPAMTALMEQAAAELVDELVPDDWTSAKRPRGSFSVKVCAMAPRSRSLISS